MSFLDTIHKRKSFTLTTVLLSLLLLLMFYIGLTYMDPPEESGILVNFGTSETGSGLIQPRAPRTQPVQPAPVTPSEVSKTEEIKELPKESAQPSEPENTEPVITQDNEESIRLAEAQKKRKAEEAQKQAEAAEKARIEQAQKEAAEKAERERLAAIEKQRQEQEAKKKALDQMMGGLSGEANNATGEGDDDGSGDKGSLNGDAYAGSYFGSGSGSGGLGYGLKGRNLVSSNRFVQECNETGRVVVQIEVDRSGKVIKATPGVKGTTNAAECLLSAARRTAQSYVWNADAKAPSRQLGFVVVNFKLGE